MSEKLNYGNDKPDYQETEFDYEEDSIRDLLPEILEHYGSQDAEEDGSESQYAISRFEHVAVDAENNGATVEYTYEHALDDGAESEYGAIRFGWRSSARRRRRGEIWVPPDIRGFRAPVFLRLADLLREAGNDRPDGTASELDEEDRHS